MSTNGLVAVACGDKCVDILDSNSKYSVQQKIKGLANPVRGHSHIPFLLIVLGRH